MSDFPQSIPPSLVYAEVRAAAHQLRSISSRLATMAGLLPLPPEEEIDRLLELASEQAFRDHPLLSLFVDLDSLVRGQLLPTADALDEASQADSVPLGPAPLRPERLGHPG